MNGHYKLVTAPVNAAMSVADAKAHVRVDFNDDDDYIDGLISVATKAIENETARKFITQTWDLYLDAFPASGSIRLPFGSLQSVSSLKYTDSANAESTVATTVYDVVTWEDPGRITLAYSQTWPVPTLRAAGGVVVRFVCGYGDAASDIPEPLVQAMKLTIGHLYENREEVMIGQGITSIELPRAVQSLISPYRLLSV